MGWRCLWSGFLLECSYIFDRILPVWRDILPWSKFLKCSWRCLWLYAYLHSTKCKLVGNGTCTGGRSADHRLIPPWRPLYPDFGCRGLPWVLISSGISDSFHILAVVLFLSAGYPGWLGYGLICWLWSPPWGGGGGYGLCLPHPPDIWCWVCKEV